MANKAIGMFINTQKSEDDFIFQIPCQSCLSLWVEREERKKERGLRPVVKSGKVSSQVVVVVVVVAGRCCIELMVQMAFLLPAKLSCNKYLCTKVKNWQGKRQHSVKKATPVRSSSSFSFSFSQNFHQVKGAKHMCACVCVGLPHSFSEIKVSWLWKMENKYCHYSLLQSSMDE